MSNIHPRYSFSRTILNSVITTWSFTGFKDSIPAQAMAGTLAKIQCTQKDWVCHAMRNASSSSLQQALDWVCSRMDCSPINPGGAHYYPNTLIDHCDWAFNSYYQYFKIDQGYNACFFGGAAALVPPTRKLIRASGLDPVQPPFFSLDVVCSQ